MRHGHPNAEETDLDALGRDQVRATREKHLKDVHFRFAAASDMQRAQTSLTLALGDASRSVVTHGDQREIGYEWLLKDRRLPSWQMPSPKPTNAFRLLEVWPPALLLGHAMWAHLQKIAKAKLFFPFHGKATTEDLRRSLECNALVAGHSGVIEAMAAVAANQDVPLVEIPVLGHADVLRFTVEWPVDDWEIGEPRITSIKHLPCPIKTPA